MAKKSLSTSKSYAKAYNLAKYGNKAGKVSGSKSSSSSYTSGGGGNYDDILKKTLAQYQSFIKPQVESLQASKNPLKDRYNNLLTEIKNRETVATQNVTKQTANELARRGIEGGGLAESTITEAVNPVKSEFAGMAKDTGIQSEADLAKIDALVAQLQGGANQNAAQTAMDLYRQQEATRQYNEQMAYQRAKDTADRASSDSANSAYMNWLKSQGSGTDSSNMTMPQIGGGVPDLSKYEETFRKSPITPAKTPIQNAYLQLNTQMAPKNLISSYKNLNTALSPQNLYNKAISFVKGW